MKKLLSAICGTMLFLSFQAQAVPVLGGIYSDADGDQWEYIGLFNVTDGAQWTNGGPTYNGLEAAELVFGALGGGQSYATSTSDTFVDHLAWYDGYGQIQHLDLPGQVGLAEDIDTDPDNDGYGYEGFGNGDWSAYIRDHVSNAQNSDNFVFVSVPAPATILLFGLGLLGTAFARKRTA